MTEGTSRQQPIGARCSLEPARSGPLVTAPVPSLANGPRYPYELGDTTLHLGTKQRLLLAILRRYTGRAVSYQFLWQLLYPGQPYRIPASLKTVRYVIWCLRRRLPPDWRIFIVDYYGYRLEHITE